MPVVQHGCPAWPRAGVQPSPDGVVPAGQLHAPVMQTDPSRHIPPAELPQHAKPRVPHVASFLQAPPMHETPLGHTMPQAPQLRESFSSSTQSTTPPLVHGMYPATQRHIDA